MSEKDTRHLKDVSRWELFEWVLNERIKAVDFTLRAEEENKFRLPYHHYSTARMPYGHLTTDERKAVLRDLKSLRSALKGFVQDGLNEATYLNTDIEAKLRRIDRVSQVDTTKEVTRHEKVRRHPYDEYTNTQRDAVEKELREVKQIFTAIRKRHEELFRPEQKVRADTPLLQEPLQEQLQSYKQKP